MSWSCPTREIRLRYLSPDDKALRAARIDDFCARNGVERAPAIPLQLTPDELEAIAGRKLEASFWGRRRISPYRKEGKRSS